MPSQLRQLLLAATVGAPEEHDAARVVDAIRRPRILLVHTP